MGVDHALERIRLYQESLRPFFHSRLLTLVGITLNLNFRTRTFFVATERHDWNFNGKVTQGSYHHTLTASVRSREERNIAKIFLNSIDSFTNPFT